MSVVEKRFAIAIDIKSYIPNTDFEVVENDNGNVIDVSLTDDGKPIDLTGCKVVVVFAKPNGTTAQQDNDEGNGVKVLENNVNEIEIELFTTSFSPGVVNAEIQVYSGENFGVLVTSALFNFKCRRGIANEETVQSTKEWPLLTGLIRRVEGMEDELDELVPRAEETIDRSNTAAEQAQEAAQNAGEKADDAATAAQAATEAAGKANAAADTAEAAGREAAQVANAAAAQAVEVAAEAAANAQQIAGEAAGKANAAADRANEAAKAAEDIVGGALPKHAHTHAKGGTDEITLDMLGAAAKTVSTAITLLADGWVSNEEYGFYDQTVPVTFLEGDRFENPAIIPEFSVGEFEEERNEWNKVDNIYSIPGAVWFICKNETPEIDLTIIVKARD